MTATESQCRVDAAGIDDLLKVMRRLRDPDGGCPWDLRQNFHSIAPYTIEEAYEVADAISRNDMPDLMDELGDLLFQVVFHAQMASEAGHFGFNDVVGAIVEKMIRRHPHVFADEVIDSEQAQSVRWEEHKAAERAQSHVGEESLMDHVPSGLAAIKRAQKLQKRAASAGFDWACAEDVLPKISEEVDELTDAMASDASAERVSEEVGDLLFSCINLARHLDVDADTALRTANLKFERRFRAMETALAAQGRTLKASDVEEMEAAWSQAKLKAG